MGFRVEVVTPESTVLSGEAVFVLARALNGDLGILEGHAPMLAGLGTGKLEVHMADGAIHRFVVAGGFLEASPDRVAVLADVAESQESVDLEAARREKEALADRFAKEPTPEVEARLRFAEARLALAEEARRS